MGDNIGNLVLGWYGIVMCVVLIMACIGFIASFSDNLALWTSIPLGAAAGVFVTWAAHWFMMVVVGFVAAMGPKLFDFIQRDFQKTIGWFS